MLLKARFTGSAVQKQSSANLQWYTSWLKYVKLDYFLVVTKPDFRLPDSHFRTSARKKILFEKVKRRERTFVVKFHLKKIKADKKESWKSKLWIRIQSQFVWLSVPQNHLSIINQNRENRTVFKYKARSNSDVVVTKKSRFLNSEYTVVSEL